MGIMLGMLLWGPGAGWSAEQTRALAEVNAVLRQALREKRVVTFVYHGHLRTVEPHALGVVTEGKPALFAWQTEGGSQTEPPPGWRTFLLAEIKELRTTETTFAKARPDYRAHKAGRGLGSITDEIAAE